MTITKLITELADAGITLSRQGDQIQIKSTNGELDKDLIERLKIAKKELLLVLDDNNKPSFQVQLPQSGEAGEIADLSRGQSRIIAATQLSNPAIYNEQAAIELADTVETGSISKAFSGLAKKHDILRTIFTNNTHQKQRVLPEPVIAISQWVVDSDDSLRVKASELARTPFQAGSPLWRVDIFSTPQRATVLVLTIHHAIFDRWSMIVLIRDFSILLSTQETITFNQQISYRDFSAWQNRWMNSPVYAKQLNNWKKTLSGIKNVSAIHSDRVRPANPSWDGKTIRVEIKNSIIEKAKTFSHSQNTTLFTTLFSVFSLLLYRYTNDPQVLSLTPAANRPFKEAEDIAGYFVNMVALTTRIQKEDCFLEVIRRMRDVTTKAFANQGVPLDAIIEELRKNGSPGYEQFSQTVFAFQNVRLPSIHTKSGIAKTFDLDSPFARFDLYLSIESDDRGTFAVWQYSVDLFEPSTIQRLSKHYIKLLESVLMQPSTELDALPILDNGEIRNLETWGKSRRPYKRNSSVVTLFQDCVVKHSQSIAVEQDSLHWTYQELNNYSDCIASKIFAKGVEKHALIGVAGERSVEFIAALIGILKVGCAYLPLDPSYPEDRLRSIVCDASPSLVIVEDGLKTDWLSNYTGITLNLSSLCKHEGKAFHITKINDVIKEVEADDLAYVMYTSGSTGKPKGVEILHRGIVRLVNNTDYASLDSSVVILQHSPLSFDASTFEIWGCLLNGGRLVLAPKEVAFLNFVPETIKKNGVTTMFVTADLFRITMEEAPSTFMGLRELLVGGDTMPVKSAYSFITQYSANTTLSNIYGPTENTTFTCFHRITTKDLEQNQVPIGKPIANSEVCITNASGNLVPIGVPGELWISGDGLSKGYLGREELTSETFAQLSLTPGQAKRWYKTGDRMRWRDDGTLEFLGRNDAQVKLRGYRIELGEIEMVLSRHPDLSGCAVVLRKKEGGEKQLVGYLTIRSDTKIIDNKEVEKWLIQRLPGYMVPRIWVRLKQLPQTVTGKLDRKLLPEPKIEVSSVGASNETEFTLVNIWKELFDLQSIGVQDNFFSLGGDSILSIQMASRAAERGLNINPQLISRYPTISDLVAYGLEKKKDNSLNTTQESVQGEVVPSPIQSWYLEWPGEDWKQFSQGAYLGFKGELEPSVLTASLQKIAEHHDTLRIKWHHDGTKWCQESAAGCVVKVLTKDLRNVRQQDIERLIASDAAELQANLRLDGESLWTARLYHTAKEWRLLWLVHHISVDGVSWRILLEDLLRIYAALKTKGEIAFPAKTTSYQAWSKKIIDWTKNLPEAEIEYWQKMNVPGTVLPTDFGDLSQNKVETESTVSIKLNTKQTEYWLQKAGDAYRMRPEELLVAALVQTISKWTGQDCILDIESHGRDGVGVDVSRTVGWFTSIYPVRFQWTGNLASDLKSVKEQIRSVPNGGVSYSALFYNRNGNSKLKPHTRTVSFNYLGQWRLHKNSELITTWLGDTPGGTRSPKMQRRYIFDIVAQVYDGCLYVDWLYSEALHKKETILLLKENFQRSIDNILDHCSLPETGGFTPSDLPLAQLEQKDIDLIEKKYTSLEKLYGVTPIQQGILFHSITDEDRSLYLEQIHWRIKGALDEKRLYRAWSDVIESHASLRTTFHWRNLKQTVQVVHNLPEIDWSTQDFRSLAKASHNTCFTELCKLDRERGFDLEKGPLLRGSLVRETENSWRFLWTFHHAIIDGWSVPIILKNVFDRYSDLDDGELEPLPKKEFLPFVKWLAEQDSNEQAIYWKQALSGISEPTSIGFESTAPAPKTTEKARCTFRFSPGLHHQVIEASRQAKLTRAILMTGAWGIMLSYTSGKKSVVFGTTLSGRPASLPGVEHMVGLFINTVPVRADINDNKIVLSWLQNLHHDQNKRSQLGAASITDIKRWAGYDQEELLSSLFVVENYPIKKVKIKNNATLELGEFTAVETRTNYPLVAQLVPSEETVLHIDFDRAMYSEESIERLGTSFLHILEQITSKLNSRLSEITLISDEDSKKLIYDWNSTPPIGESYLLHSGVQKYATTSPLSPAIIDGKSTTTYLKLYEEMSRVAQTLLEKDIKKAIVAVLLPRSAHAVAAYCGVMCAGCAYVPLDPSMPPERLLDIVSVVDYVITTESFRNSLHDAAAKVIIIRESANNNPLPFPEVSTKDLAYVIFTSGSTGKPKGVMVTHYAASLTIEAILQPQKIGRFDRLMCVSSTSFDLSVFDFFGAFSAGAAVILAPESSKLAPAAWLDLMIQEKVTVWESVPAVMELLLLECRKRNSLLPSHLKLVMLSGDRIPVRLPKQIRETTQSALKILALGGATEAAIWSCYYDTKNLDKDATFVPYGRHLPGQRLYVLSSSLKPLPIGVPGDLWIAGTGVALGYLGQADLTSYRFVKDPYVPGEQMYRTGDRARVLTDGNLEFIGRVDDQVKINGFRIEIGDIESALSSLKGVERGVASIIDRGGKHMIVGYVLLRPAQRFELSLALEVLAKRLPAYMIPATILVIEDLPLSPNGKLDRKRLPEPKIEVGNIKARNKTESILVDIWRELLGLNSVGVKDNFFALGGDSIMSIQMVSRAAEYGLHINPQKIFRHPTISSLVEQGLEEVIETRNIAEQGVVEGEIMLSPVQSWYLEWPGEDWEQFSQGAYLGFSSTLDAERLINALQGVASHHDALRAKWHYDGTKWCQESNAGTPLEILIKDLRDFPEANVEKKIEHYASKLQEKLRLDSQSLWLAQLYRMKTGWRLIWLIHHASVDGVSWRILLEDLWRAYADLEKGPGISLPSKTISYQLWSEKISEWALHLPERYLQYWQEMNCPGMNLPIDNNAPFQNTVGTEARVSAELDKEKTDLWLKKAGNAYRMRPEELLLSALAYVLSKWTGTECVLDIESHGRDGLPDLDTSRTIGWFTSIYPIRLPIKGNLVEDLKNIKEQIRGIPHGGVSYGALRYKTKHTQFNEYSRNICFNYLGQWRFDQNTELNLTWLGDPPGFSRLPTMRRRYVFEIVAQVHNGNLCLNWLYSTAMYQKKTVARLLDNLLTELETIITHCMSPQVGGLTPSDLPLSHLSQDDIDTALNLLKG